MSGVFLKEIVTWHVSAKPSRILGFLLLTFETLGVVLYEINLWITNLRIRLYDLIFYSVRDKSY